jgi:hypothetical protein
MIYADLPELMRRILPFRRKPDPPKPPVEMKVNAATCAIVVSVTLPKKRERGHRL